MLNLANISGFLLMMAFGETIDAVPTPVEVPPAVKNLVPGYGESRSKLLLK